jgi:hypothetical protein
MDMGMRFVLAPPSRIGPFYGNFWGPINFLPKIWSKRGRRLLTLQTSSYMGSEEARGDPQQYPLKVQPSLPTF